MAEDKRPRPVSGEIMADEPDAAARRGGQNLGTDIVDAEFETIADPEIQSRPDEIPAATSIGTSAAPLAGMDMLRGGRRQPPRGASVRGGPLFWAFGIGLAAAAFWVSGGHALVRNAPFLATQPTGQALRISDVKSRVDISGARPVLFVDGEAANDGSTTEILPALAIVVTDNDGRMIRYRLGTGSRSMAPGETFAFSSRLDVPKNGVKTVSVTFGE